MNKKKGTDRNLFGMKVQVIYQVFPPPNFRYSVGVFCLCTWTSSDSAVS